MVVEVNANGNLGRNYALSLVISQQGIWRGPARYGFARQGAQRLWRAAGRVDAAIAARTRVGG